MSNPNPVTMVSEKSILDYFNKQCYLGNQYILPNPGASLSDTDEHPIGIITNPAGSGRALYLTLNTISSSDVAFFRIYNDPTITSLGSLATPLNLRTGSTNESVAVCALTPTIAANGTLVTTAGSEVLISVLSNLLIILDPGHSQLITAQTSADGPVDVFFASSWYELATP